MVRRSRRLLSCAVLAAACVSLHAAELGDVRVASHRGQPLVADIELTMLEDPATPVGVRIADREVYSGAGLAVPPVLSSLNLSVMRRDGRQFLHVTSLRPVDAEHLHLYLELSDKGQRAVRLATLWLTPDPNPAPVAAPAPVPVAASTPAASAAAPAAAVAAAARAPARPRIHAEPAVPAENPSAKAVRAEGEAKPARPAPAAKPLPLALPLAGANAHPPACSRPSDDAQACTALGTKNADLRAQLGRLEDKVKVLQARLGVTPGAHGAAPVQPDGAATPAPAHAAAAAAAKPAPAHAEPAHSDAEPAHAADAGKPAPPSAAHDADAPKPAPTEEARPPVPAKPKPIHSIKTLVPQKPKAPAADDSLPWTWIGAAAGLLALAGTAVALVVAARRRRARNVDIPDAPGLLDKLKRRFAARTQAPAPAAAAPQPDAEHAEPTLE